MVTICIVVEQLLVSLWVPNLATGLRHMAGRTPLGGVRKTRESESGLSPRLGQALWIVTTCAGLWVESTGLHL
jgi:hypothetical protein